MVLIKPKKQDLNLFLSIFIFNLLVTFDWIYECVNIETSRRNNVGIDPFFSKWTIKSKTK
jgi:hypothetical protein